jgi:signal transduction histidine kinase
MADQSEKHVPIPDYMPHVMVVDDEVDIRQMISICLMQAKFRVSLAANTEDAYALLEQHTFDAVLTDVMMPGEDGITFLGRVHQRFPDMPVIIMTGYAQLQMAVNAIKNGAFEFIHKPFDFTYLRKIVEKAVNYSKLQRLEQNYRAELEETVEQRTEELKAAVTQLNSARMALLKAANEKSEFMATVTHEMRTPMNGVIGGLDLLADAGLNGAQCEYLLLARQAADNMVELVDRMLSFTSGAGRTSSDCHETIDLPVTIEAVVMNHRNRFAEKGLSFDVQLSPGLPRHIICNSEQFARLLDILLGNAFKFTEKGGARLDVDLERMEADKAVIRVTVADSGIGIPQDMLDRIFDPFTQVDGARNRRFGGVGLGLSIARQIAEVLNGKIHVESAPGEGSRFNFIMHADVK